MRELFVYYRVRNADAAAAREAVASMQKGLRVARPGLYARLLVRQGDDDGRQTWMETYAAAPASPDIDAAFEALMGAHAKSLARFIDGIRHVEIFDADLDN